MTRFKELGFMLGAGFLLYFSLQAVLGLLHELYNPGNFVRLLLLFPATKVVGDLIMIAIRGGRIHSYWEDWFRETGRFLLISSVGVVISAEFWKNFLELDAYPDLTVVVVICYLLLDWSRKGVNVRRYELF